MDQHSVILQQRTYSLAGKNSRPHYNNNANLRRERKREKRAARL